MHCKKCFATPSFRPQSCPFNVYYLNEPKKLWLLKIVTLSFGPTFLVLSLANCLFCSRYFTRYVFQITQSEVSWHIFVGWGMDKRVGKLPATSHISGRKLKVSSASPTIRKLVHLTKQNANETCSIYNKMLIKNSFLFYFMLI